MTVEDIHHHFLSLREAALRMTLYGYPISHQAISKWRAKGVPAKWQERFQDLTNGDLEAEG